MRLWEQPLLLRLIAGSAGLLTLLLIAWLALISQRGLAPTCSATLPLLLLRVANLLVPIITAAHLLRVSASPHLRGAAFFAVFNWFVASIFATSHLAHCDSRGLSEVWASPGLGVANGVAVALRVAWSNLLVMQRVRALEVTAQQDFGVRHNGVATCVLFALVLVFRFLMKDGKVSATVGGSVMAAGFLLATPVFVVPVVRAWRALDAAEAQGSAAAMRRVCLARRALHWQAVALLGSWLSCAFWVVHHHSWSLQCHGELRSDLTPAWEVWRRCGGHFIMHLVAICADEDFNALVALTMSGALSGAAKGSQLRAQSEKARQQRWQSSARRWREGQPTKGDDVQGQWHNKVRELAGRGVTLEALLTFHHDLRKTMPHFDPQLHTTADVVHQAIIPLSSSQKTAMAPVLMQGKCTVPDMMVTHSWGNLWIDLLAAVCADALEEADYAKIAHLLVKDPDRLEQWIRHRGRLSRSYWICALAVNQHLGICASIGKPHHRDPVTGQLPAPCTCGAERAWNDTPPLLPDGRSVLCEMNKFDDMMGYLSSQNLSFGQVVAVDATFQLFRRAWCIAEIAEANHAGMLQQLKVQSEEGLSQHSKNLQLLRIQDMEAARAEDKDYILQSIGSKEEQEDFNSQIRRLLLEDLLPAWSSLDLADQMALAGCIIRWQGSLH